MSRYRMTSTTQPGGETRCGHLAYQQHKRLGCIEKVLKTYTLHAIPQVKTSGMTELDL